MAFLARTNVSLRVWEEIVGTEREQIKFADLNKNKVRAFKEVKYLHLGHRSDLCGLV